MLSLHRRIVAALLAAGAVLLMTHSLTTGPPSVSVAVVVDNVEAGHEVAAGGLAIRELPVEAVPADAIRDLADAAGRPAAVALAPGTVLRPPFLGRGSGAPGMTLVPVLLGDEGVRSMLRPGDVVSLVTVQDEGVVVVASGIRVAALADDSTDAAFAVGSHSPGPVLVEAPAAEAARLAALGQAGQLSVVFGPA